MKPGTNWQLFDIYILNTFLKINFHTIKLIIVNIAIFAISFNIGTNSTILNHQLKYVKPTINNPIIINVKTNLYGDTRSFECSLFLDFDKVNNNENPDIAVAITHNVE